MVNPYIYIARSKTIKFVDEDGKTRVVRRESVPGLAIPSQSTRRQRRSLLQRMADGEAEVQMIESQQE